MLFSNALTYVAANSGLDFSALAGAPGTGTVSYPRLRAEAGVQNGTTNGQTVNMFIDSPLGRNASFAASVVTACPELTVYAMRCVSPRTSYSVGVGIVTCGPDTPDITVTAGPKTYIVSTSATAVVPGTSAAAILSEGCALQGTTAATCVASISASISTSGVSTSASYTSTVTLAGTDYKRYDVTITGGAEKLAQATGACPATKPNAGATVNFGTVAGTAAGFMIAAMGILMS